MLDESSLLALKMKASARVQLGNLGRCRYGCVTWRRTLTSWAYQLVGPSLYRWQTWVMDQQRSETWHLAIVRLVRKRRMAYCWLTTSRFLDSRLVLLWWWMTRCCIHNQHGILQTEVTWEELKLLAHCFFDLSALCVLCVVFVHFDILFGSHSINDERVFGRKQSGQKDDPYCDDEANGIRFGFRVFEPNFSRILKQVSTCFLTMVRQNSKNWWLQLGKWPFALKQQYDSRELSLHVSQLGSDAHLSAIVP